MKSWSDSIGCAAGCRAVVVEFFQALSRSPYWQANNTGWRIFFSERKRRMRGYSGWRKVVCLIKQTALLTIRRLRLVEAAKVDRISRKRTSFSVLTFESETKIATKLCVEKLWGDTSKYIAVGKVRQTERNSPSRDYEHHASSRRYVGSTICFGKNNVVRYFQLSGRGTRSEDAAVPRIVRVFRSEVACLHSMERFTLNEDLFSRGIRRASIQQTTLNRWRAPAGALFHILFLVIFLHRFRSVIVNIRRKRFTEATY